MDPTGSRSYRMMDPTGSYSTKVKILTVCRYIWPKGIFQTFSGTGNSTCRNMYDLFVAFSTESRFSRYME